MCKVDFLLLILLLQGLGLFYVYSIGASNLTLFMKPMRWAFGIDNDIKDYNTDGGAPIDRLRHFVAYQSKTKYSSAHRDNLESDVNGDDIDGDSTNYLTKVSGIGDILVERMDHFVAVGCINADKFELAQKALRGQLQSIPELVREDLMNAALIERTSVYNVIQNSSKPMLHTMVASAYLGWYSTVFTPPSHYASCIMVSGISFVPGETVVGYETKKTVKKIGETPCQCNFFKCLVCPVFDEQTTKTPIFKTDILTLDQHDALHEYMVEKAIQLAGKTMSIQQDFVTGDSLNLKDKVLRNGWERSTNTNTLKDKELESNIDIVLETIEEEGDSDENNYMTFEE